MSTARVTLKFGPIPFEAFFAGAANVIFRHASTGVWVKEVREYVRECTRVRTRVRAREKLVDPVWFDNQGWEYMLIGENVLRGKTKIDI